MDIDQVKVFAQLHLFTIGTIARFGTFIGVTLQIAFDPL